MTFSYHNIETWGKGVKTVCLDIFWLGLQFMQPFHQSLIFDLLIAIFSSIIGKTKTTYVNIACKR